jgi:hypothetical protein
MSMKNSMTQSGIGITKVAAEHQKAACRKNNSLYGCSVVAGTMAHAVKLALNPVSFMLHAQI